MINKTTLFQAKSFLCWDKFPELTIKLIPIQNSVGFFYPPQDKFSTIVLFYDAEIENFTEPLCLLFHEVGHYVEWELSRNFGYEKNFYEVFNLDKGIEKIKFELQAWIRGEGFLKQFLEKEKIKDTAIRNKYKKLQDISLETYND